VEWDIFDPAKMGLYCPEVAPGLKKRLERRLNQRLHSTQRSERRGCLDVRHPMPNPSDPQTYAVDPKLRVFLFNYDPDNFNVNNDPFGGLASSPGSAAPFLFPSSGRPPLRSLSASEFLDYQVTDQFTAEWGNSLGMRSTLPSMQPGQILALYHSDGWGRDIDVMIEFPAEIGAITTPMAPPTNRAWIFGSYPGPLFLREGLAAPVYAPYFTDPAGAPVFSFAPDIIPFYSLTGTANLAGTGTGTPWPQHVDWPVLNVSSVVTMSAKGSRVGQLRIQTQVSSGDDNYDHTDPNGNRYQSGARNIKLFCLPITFQSPPDLRMIPGRSVAVNIAVNGSPVAELSLLRWSRPGYMPAVEQSLVRIDELASADLLAGSLRQDLPLFVCEGPGVPLELVLSYSSEASLYYRDAAREPDKAKAVWTPFGHGWSCSYGIRILGPVMDLKDPGGPFAFGPLAGSSAPLPDCFLVQDSAGCVDVFQRDYDPNAVPPDQLAEKTYYPGSILWSRLFAHATGPVTLFATGQGFQISAGSDSDIYTFGADGRLSSIRRPTYSNGLSIQWSGDDFSATDSSGRVMNGTAGPDGRITTIVDPNGGAWTFGYEGPSLIRIDSPEGELVSFGYDETTFVMTSRAFPSGRETAYGYGYNSGVPVQPCWGALISSMSRNRVTRVASPAHIKSRVHSFDYTVGAMATSLGSSTESVVHKDPRQNSSGVGTTRFDVVTNPPAAGASLVVTAADGSHSDLEIDETNAVSFVSVASGATISTNEGLAAQIDYPDGSSLVYDCAFADPLHPNLPTTYTAPDGTQENYSYQDIGGASGLLNTTARSDPSGISAAYSASYGWQAPGDLQMVTENNGRTTRYDYYSVPGKEGLKFHAYISVAGVQTEVKTFDYDPFGRVSSLSTSNETREYGYDSLGRMISEKLIRNGLSLLRRRAYSPSGLMITFVDVDTSTVVGNYDPQGWLLDATLTDATGRKSLWSYTPDENGNITEEAGPTGGVEYGFDPLDRVSKITAVTSPTLPWLAIGFDADGPRLAGLPPEFAFPLARADMFLGRVTQAGFTWCSAPDLDAAVRTAALHP